MSDDQLYALAFPQQYQNKILSEKMKPSLENNLKFRLSLTFAPPLFLLVLGWALLWAFSGFTNPRLVCFYCSANVVHKTTSNFHEVLEE